VKQWICKKLNSDLCKTRSPSHWQFSGSCLQCSVQIRLHFENDFQGSHKIEVRSKMKIQAVTQPIKTVCNFNLLVYSEHVHVNWWRQVCFCNAETSRIENYWSFGSGLAEIKVLIFKRSITARAITDDKSSCGVVPASKWKGVLYVVENKHCARSLSNIVYMKYQCLQKAIKRQKKINISHFDSSDYHQGWWQL